MKAEIEGKTVKLPDFLIVGAGKSGTTSLYHYLKQHPQIFLPDNKEPHFFSSETPHRMTPTAKAVAKEIIWKFDDYLGLFAAAKEDQVLGEASTSYLYHYERTIKNIKRYIPGWQDLKIIIILRDPVERAFSHYLMLRMIGEEPLEFEDALGKCDSRGPIFDYIGTGLFYERVKAYMEHFPNVRVYLFGDLKRDPSGLVKDLFRFLGVDDSFVPDVGEKHNPSGEPKSRFLQRLLNTPDVISFKIPLVKWIPLGKRAEMVKKLKLRNLRRPDMKKATKRHLRALYREDILKLQELIGRDLSAWLE